MRTLFKKLEFGEGNRVGVRWWLQGLNTVRKCKVGHEVPRPESSGHIGQAALL